MISTGGSFLSVWRMVPFVTTILPNSAERREPPRPHTSQKSATSKLKVGGIMLPLIYQLISCLVGNYRHSPSNLAAAVRV